LKGARDGKGGNGFPLPPLPPLPPFGLGHPISRRGRDFHVRHDSIRKAGLRRKLRKLDQLEKDFALALRFDAAQRAVSKVHGPGGREQPLCPELDFIDCEMHGDVSHWVSYGLVLGLVSVSAIFQVRS
jgi:hypothetical protein